MHIALDISPLTSGHSLQHRVRGTGFYTQYLKNSLQMYFPNDSYTFFSQNEKLPSTTNVVHIPYFEPFFLTTPIKKSYPTVVTIHDLTPLIFPQHFPPGIKGAIRWQVQKLLTKNMDKIITDSESSKKDIIKIMGVKKEKIHVVYLAAAETFKPIRDRESISKSIKKKYNLPNKFGLYVGDITWNKNLPRLITAIKSSGIPFVMVGKALREDDFDTSNPWNQDRLICQKLLADAKNIILPGFVSEDDLLHFYNCAALFTMPSLYEGFGLPILEAMQSGCPVITTKEGSLPEVAGDAAYYVDAYDVTSIQEGIENVFSSDRLQKTLREKGIKQAQRFSWEKTAQATHTVYEQIAL